MASCCSLSFSTVSSKPNKPYSSPISSSLELPFTSQLPFSKKYSLYSNHTLLQTQCRKTQSPDCPSFLVRLAILLTPFWFSRSILSLEKWAQNLKLVIGCIEHKCILKSFTTQLLVYNIFHAQSNEMTWKS